VKTLEEELTNSVKRVKDREREIHQAKQEVFYFRDRVARMESVSNVLRDQLTDLDATKARNTKLLAKNETLEEQLKKLQAIDLLLTEAEKRGNIGDLDGGSIEATQASLKIMCKKYYDLSAEKQTMSSRVKALTREIESLKQDLKEANRKAKRDDSRDSKPVRGDLTPIGVRYCSGPRDAFYKTKTRDVRFADSSDDDVESESPPQRRASSPKSPKKSVSASGFSGKVGKPSNKVDADSSDESGEFDVQPMWSRLGKSSPRNSAKMKLRSMKRSDGFGGRATLENVAPTTSSRSKPLQGKRKQQPVVKKGTGKRMPTRKVKSSAVSQETDDSSVIVISD